MKPNRPTKIPNKPRGFIYGARWANVPVQARPCLVTVGVVPKGWWCEGRTGEELKAIEVKMQGQTVYINNSDGRALDVFLKGLAPLPRFQYVPVFFVTDDPDSEVFYKAKVSC